MQKLPPQYKNSLSNTEMIPAVQEFSFQYRNYPRSTRILNQYRNDLRSTIILFPVQKLFPQYKNYLSNKEIIPAVQ